MGNGAFPLDCGDDGSPYLLRRDLLADSLHSGQGIDAEDAQAGHYPNRYLVGGYVLHVRLHAYGGAIRLPAAYSLYDLWGSPGYGALDALLCCYGYRGNHSLRRFAADDL
ncbi:hypothetical protein D3C73_1303880 [compost metagenome]